MDISELEPQGAARIDESLKFLGLRGNAAIYKLMKSGELKSFHIGRRRMILWSELQSFLKRQVEASSENFE